MNLLSILLQTPAGGSQWSGILMMVVIVAIFYFFMIRPQQKKQKEMMDSLKEGSEVVTVGGIKGTIVSVSEDYVEVRVDKGVKITFTKGAISRVL